MKAIYFDNPAMGTQNSHNRFKENCINEEQKTEESSNKASSQVVRKESIPENASNSSTIRNGSSFIGFDWSTVMEEDTPEMSLKEAILDKIDLKTLEKGTKKYQMYLDTISGSSQGLKYLKDFDESI